MNQLLNISDCIEFEDLKVCFLKEQIFYLQVSDEAVVNRSMQERINDSIQKLKPATNLKYPLVVELGEFISITDNLIEHSDLQFSGNILCISVYVKKTSDRLLAKYYSHKFNMTEEYRFFRTLEEALEFSKSAFESYKRSMPLHHE